MRLSRIALVCALLAAPGFALAETPAAAPPPASAAAPAAAALGQPAPGFTLPSVDGTNVSLADFKGKIVVLEWFNPECPFVKAAHTEGALKDMAARETGVVWLAINSNAVGKQGHGAEANKAGRDAFGLKHPILLDAAGTVGRAYGAERTPHVMVVDAAGNLVYRGGLDNTGSGRPSDAKNYVNHLAEALVDVKAGKPVRTPETKAWGCGVKYGG